MTRPLAAQRPHGLANGPQAHRVAVYLDPPTNHFYGGRLFARESNPYAGDKILAPFAAVEERLEASGIPVRTMDCLPEVPDGRQNIIISYGTPDRMPSQSVARYRALSTRPDITLSALFAMECPIVEPLLFEALPQLHRLFRRIMSWSDTTSLLPFTRTPVAVEHFSWPQSFHEVHEQLWSQTDRQFLLMMNANKLPRLYVDELYTARLRAVEYFNRFGEIDLYGRNWTSAPRRVGKTRTPRLLRVGVQKAWELKQRLRPDPLYVAAAAASRGPALSKSETFSRYRFALCFENSILNGWITEKIFDCFFAGTIPIYWGAPDILDWVPAGCFVDMRQFGDFAELRAFLHGLTPQQEETYRNEARQFLASDAFAPFRIDRWVDLHLKVIAADTGLVL